jgi:protein involved in temperature-dependent protein secretion
MQQASAGRSSVTFCLQARTFRRAVIASTPSTWGDPAMDAVMAAIRTGDYARAYEALQQTAEAGTTVGSAIGALLLALIERFDDADRLVRAADLPAFEVIVQGERQRTARWRDPEASGSFAATAATARAPLYAAMGVAFARRDEALADRTKAELENHGRPIGGTLTFQRGEPRAFEDIADCDDAIGRMLETYCNQGLLYFPFETLRRIEVLPRTNFMDFLMPKVKITDASGTATAYVPLLYACSATSPDEGIRNGRETVFDYLGNARRGQGQRDFVVDGSTLVGLQNIAAIDFA